MSETLVKLVGAVDALGHRLEQNEKTAGKSAKNDPRVQTPESGEKNIQDQDSIEQYRQAPDSMEKNRVDEHSTCLVVGKNFDFYNTGEFIDKIQERMPTKARFNTQHPDHGKRCANGDILLVAMTNKDREQIIADTAPEN